MRPNPISSLRAAHREAPNLDFQHGDAAKLPFADGALSSALGQLVLNFVPDPLAVVREMARVTRPGGVVAAAVWDFCGGLVYQRLFWDTAAGIDPSAGAARDRLFSHPLAAPDGLQRLWISAGISDIESASLTIRMDYANFDDYWDLLLGGQGPVGVYVAGLDGEMRARLRASVRAAFLTGRPDGPRSLAASAWAVRGLLSWTPIARRPRAVAVLRELKPRRTPRWPSPRDTPRGRICPTRGRCRIACSRRRVRSFRWERR